MRQRLIVLRGLAEQNYPTRHPKRDLCSALVTSLALSIACSGIAGADPLDPTRSVLTQRNDSSRDGEYSAEMALMPQVLRSGHLGLLANRKVDGLISAQPLRHAVDIRLSDFSQCLHL
jgi:hypothetical protein